MFDNGKRQLLHPKITTIIHHQTKCHFADTPGISGCYVVDCTNTQSCA